MPPPKALLEELAKRAELKAQIAKIGDMRPGSLVEHYRKCGKASCHCAQTGSRGHGPQWLVTHAIAGKTVTKVIPAGPAVERTREQIAEYQHFRDVSRELVQTSERICNAHLDALGTEPARQLKKNRARRSLPGRSGPRDRNAGRSPRR